MEEGGFFVLCLYFKREIEKEGEKGSKIILGITRAFNGNKEIKKR